MPYVPDDSNNIFFGDPGVGEVGSNNRSTVKDRSTVATAYNFLQNPSLAGASALYGADIFPFRNELDKFASYAPIFTLGCLTNLEYNFPLSYRILGPLVKIIRSGGRGGPTIPSLYDLGGKREFFIEDVMIENTVAPNPRSRHSNATSITFKVIEPYSMGQFFHNLRSASLVTGHPNYQDAPFLISVAFIGYDDEGNVSSSLLSQRHFPIQLVQVEMEVSEGGAVYHVQAAPYSDRALTNNTVEIPIDVAIKGRTVGEVLQTGAQSLTAELNGIADDQDSAGQTGGAANKYVIQFPNSNNLGAVSGAINSVASAINGSLGSIGTGIQDWYQGLVGDQGALPPRVMERLAENTNIFSLGSILGDKLKAEAIADMNAIGRSPLIEPGSTFNAGDTPYQYPSFAEDPANPGRLKRGSISYDPEANVYTFESGTTIPQMIEEVIISSEYGRNYARMRANMAGGIEWFRIEAQTYNAGSLFGGLITGRDPKIFVYRVRKWISDGSNYSAPNNGSFTKTFIKQLLTPKAYSYIYTGQNKDVIDFDLKFDQMFFTGVNAARSQKQILQRLGSQLGLGQKQTDTVVTTGNNLSVNTSASSGGRTEDTARTSTQGNTGANGGNGFDDALTGSARYFNEMMINSSNDMIQAKLKIHGDPYFICDVGIGNYLGLPSSPLLPVTIDGSMNPMDGEVYIILNFKTPIDYNESDGFVEYPLGGFLPIAMFSGIYRVIKVENNFDNGQFTQTLELARNRNQDISIESVAGALINKLLGGGGATLTQGSQFNRIGNRTQGPDDTT
jgi:hypothetical protein